MSESRGVDRVERRSGGFAWTETWHAPGLVLAPHEHAHACLHFVLAGGYQESAGGRDDVHGPGAVLYKPAGTRHANRFEAPGARTLRVELAPEFERRVGPRARGARVERGAELELLARRMHGELFDADDLAPLALEGLTLELCALLFRAEARAGTRGDLAEDCAALLRERYRDTLVLGALARELGCSRTALAHAFRRRFALSMGAYVRQLRVAEVLRRLDDDDGPPLARLALEVGFADQSHLTRVFRRLTGMTPGRWMARTRVPGRHTRASTRRGAG
jgi:AraC-like DNA-binding protein